MRAISNTADIRAAMQELLREQQVRERCYPRWVREGKQLNQYEATERLERLALAIDFLREHEALIAVKESPHIEILPEAQAG